ncbi:DUF443 family protein [Enterococcus sp. AZ020]
MIKNISNKRYKFLIYENETYLLDLDTKKITWLLPFLVWFLPMKAYLLSEDEITLQQNISIRPKQGRLGSIVLIASLLASSLVGILDEKFWKTVYFDNKLLLSISLLFIWVSTMIIRYFIRSKKNEFISKGKPMYVKFHFSGTAAVYLLKFGLAMLFFYSILYFMSSIFINFGNILTLGIIIPIIYLLSIVNTTILPFDEIDRVEFLDEN